MHPKTQIQWKLNTKTCEITIAIINYHTEIHCVMTTTSEYD